MAIGFAYFAGALQHSALVRNYAATGVLAKWVTEEDCENFLARTSATYQQFRELSREFEVKDPLYKKTEFNLLNKRPLIASGKELLVPVPRFLAYRVSEGIYFDIMDLMSDPGGKANPFLSYFGRLFEEYVGKLLKWTFGEDNVIHEPLYGKPQRGGPDWIVLDGQTALLFECRTSRLRLDSKVYGQQADLIEDAKRIFLETLSKYSEKVEDLQTGKAGVNVRDIGRFERVIVTYDPLYLESYFRNIAAEEAAKGGVPYSNDYHLIGIADLEVLSAWNNSNSIQSVLFERSRQVANGSGDDFNAFVRRYSREHGLATGHPLLQQVQDEFFAARFDLEAQVSEAPDSSELAGA